MNDNIPSGNFVAQHLSYLDTGNDIIEEDIQPNGVDLGIDRVERVAGRAVFKDDDYDEPRRTRIQPQEVPAEDVSVPVYSLPYGNYIVTYNVKVQIPDGYVGHVYPRSRLMRCGLHLTTALWDQGYVGLGEGLLKIPHSVNRATIPTDMRIAQMTFRPADRPDQLYDGTHQHEGMEASDV